MSEDPQSQPHPPNGPSLRLWSPLRRLVHSAPGDSVNISSHPGTSFLPLQLPILLS